MSIRFSERGNETDNNTFALSFQIWLTWVPIFYNLFGFIKLVILFSSPENKRKVKRSRNRKNLVDSVSATNSTTFELSVAAPVVKFEAGQEGEYS